jgi:hypothetical protein
MDTIETEAPSIVITGKVSKKGAWSLTRGNGELILKSKSGNETYSFPQADFHKKIELRGKVNGRPLLIVSLPKRCGFEMSKGDVATVQEWLGPLSLDHLKFAIKQASSWSLPVGVFFVVIAFFGENGSFDFMSAILGALMLLIFMLSKLMTHHIVLLLNTLWCALVVANIGYDLFRGASLAWNIPFLLVLAWCTKYSWGEYQRFRKVTQNDGDVEQSHAEATSETAPFQGTVSEASDA